MKLPFLVEECPICKGVGEYEQPYIEGFLTGPCSHCKHPSVFMKGLGYRMKSEAEVPLSVINQINIMNNIGE